jgi:hypothetical protein
VLFTIVKSFVAQILGLNEGCYCFKIKNNFKEDCDCRMLLSLTVSLTNVANVNDPLEALLVLRFNSKDSLIKVFLFLIFSN